MVKKEYNNTGFTVGQINRAIDKIVADHKADYKLEGYFPDAVLLKCRTGYGWGLIAEIMWDKVDNGHNDVIIECRNDDQNAAAIKMPQSDMERHLQQVSDLFMKYAAVPEPPPEPLKRRNFSKARNILAAAIVVVIAIAGLVFYLMETKS